MNATIRSASHAFLVLLIVGGMTATAHAGPGVKMSAAVKRRVGALAQLEEARAAALALIHDEVKYSDVDSGRSSQGEVDKLTEQVGRLWKKVEPLLVKDLKTLHRRSNREKLAALVSTDPSKLNAWELALLGHFGDLQTRQWNQRLVAELPKDTQIKQAQIQEVILTNEYRMMMGLRALRIELVLIDAARSHSVEMRTLGYFDHVSPVAGRRMPWDRAKLAGFPGPMVGENIAMGYETAEEVHEGWRTSPAHHRNMLAPEWERIGVAFDDDHWTQMFGRVTKPKDASAAAKP